MPRSRSAIPRSRSRSTIPRSNLQPSATPPILPSASAALASGNQNFQLRGHQLTSSTTSASPHKGAETTSDANGST